MAQQITSTQKNGFVHSCISKLQDTNYSPIYGYQDLSDVTLEKAVENVEFCVPGVKAFASKATKECYKRNTELTLDEAAAIYLYTMPNSFHTTLNDRLRAENRDELAPWLAFLKLFITALEKLPSLAITVWRGVAEDISSAFFEEFEQIWWTVNSCSTDLNVIQGYINMNAGTGTVFAIETLHGKDVSKYSAFGAAEREVILMPGTRVHLQSLPLEIKDGLRIACFKECTPIPAGKHVMVSYDSNSQEIVSKIYHHLQLKHMPLWLNEQKETTNDLKKSLAEGVENAAMVCCFMTPDYEKSYFCQLELQYAQKRQKRIIPCMLTDIQVWKPSNWLEPITKHFAPIDFYNVSEPSIMQIKVWGLIDRIENQPQTSQNIQSQVADKPSYLFELIKYRYKQNSRIERFMNPAKSFPIDQSYINLAIVGTKDQHEKEKKLRDSQHNDAIMEAFENIHGTKTPVDIKDIFKTCKKQTRNVLVFGRAGIGKSTFCRYIAYQWATGMIWQEYELIVLVPMRSLTEDNYPALAAGINYSLIDVLKKECISCDQYLSKEDETQLQEQFCNSRILWLLDGYDEIVQNVPTHLKSLLNDQLLKTPHHIITSRPYMNTLSHPVQLEITGFIDDDISITTLGHCSQRQRASENDRVYPRP
ncbi:unnamed protein product [Adineta steineri]|uniref:NAD(P)(+)--arginine ADP-ribosyltransferase n=1 Tax=Adineta steineri TaxID=433720 RepID=A0A818QEM1_9BILA|nr:unnamed protein product [Adineta steineri]